MIKNMAKIIKECAKFTWHIIVSFWMFVIFSGVVITMTLLIKLCKLIFNILF